MSTSTNIYKIVGSEGVLDILSFISQKKTVRLRDIQHSSTINDNTLKYYVRSMVESSLITKIGNDVNRPQYTITELGTAILNVSKQLENFDI